MKIDHHVIEVSRVTLTLDLDDVISLIDMNVLIKDVSPSYQIKIGLDSKHYTRLLTIRKALHGYNAYENNAPGEGNYKPSPDFNSKTEFSVREETADMKHEA